MKGSTTIFALLKRWRFVLASAAVLLLSVVLLLLFPREEHLVLSTVFALLFWLALIASFVFMVLAVRNRGKPKAETSPQKRHAVGFTKKSERREENLNEQ